MNDVTTEAGYSEIVWVCAPRDTRDKQWLCRPILHDGDGPLDKRCIIARHEWLGVNGWNKDKITAAEAAEIAARRIYQIGELSEGDRMTIRVAVQISGVEWCAFGVVVEMEPTFTAREL